MLQPALLLLMLVAMETTFTSDSPPSNPMMSQVSVLEGSNVTLHCPVNDSIQTEFWGKQKRHYPPCDTIGKTKKRNPICPQASDQSGQVEIWNTKCKAKASNVWTEAIKTWTDNIKLENKARRLIIDNIQQKDGGTYYCCVHNRDEPWIYDLTVIKGCKRDLMNQTDFTGYDIFTKFFTTSSASACRENCTQLERCQFFTFETTTGTCFLKRSPEGTKSINVTFIEDKISGYSLRNCSNKVLYPAKKYHLVNEMKNWTEAQAFCRLNYTDLAIITTAVDRNAVQHQLELNSTCVDWTPTAWIGLYRNVSEDPWKWSDGENLMYLNWENGYDSNKSYQHSYRCAISVNSSWRPVDCNDQKPYVCEFVSQSNGTTEKVYQLENDQKNQTDAADDCRNKDRVLASILNQEEQNAFDEVTLNQSWIGFQSYSNTSNEWNWLSKRPFEAWGNSMVIGEELCAKINPDKKWKTENCSQLQTFLCFDGNPTNDVSGSPSTTSTIGPPTSSSSPTPPGYLHYYNISTSWIDALVFCEAKNRSLVHITNSTVQGHVAQLLDKETLPQGVWIGLERAVFLVNSSWKWTSGQEVQNYTQWHKYFPLNPFQFHCGKMIRDSNCKLTWLDACCHVKLPFICQDLRSTLQPAP